MLEMPSMKLVMLLNVGIDYSEVVVDGNLGKNQENYVKIMADANLSNCSVDKIIFGEDVILLAIGDMCGIVSLISFTKASTFWTYRITSQEKIFSGQIHSVIWAGRNVLLISGPDGIAVSILGYLL